MDQKKASQLPDWDCSPPSDIVMNEACKTKIITGPDHFRVNQRYLNKEFLDILQVQIYLQPLNKYGRLWPPQFQQFTLNLYFNSPKAYRYLAKVLSLPTAVSLQTWLSSITMKPGVFSQVLELLKEKAKNWEMINRACTLDLTKFHWNEICSTIRSKILSMVILTPGTKGRRMWRTLHYWS